jgi:alkylation response protein AidB-like acyl-CoA dehydrogenase
MDLTYTPAEEAFRDEVRTWLRDNVPDPRLPRADDREGFEAHRAWERKLHDAGFAGMHWPAQYGGRGAGVVQQAIFIEEYLLAGGPERINQLGLDLLGPTVMVHGTEEQKRRWLPRILSAEDVWSQGFSEPDAGSDLAGLKTRAVREGDDFVVNGQKIWTSYGAFADWIFAMVRTDPEAPRHSGVTFLAIDMRSEGVEARPIVQLDGHAGFAEVFFTDVRVPATQVIGEVNQGWTVAMTTLGFERDTPAASPARFARAVAHLVAISKERGLDRDELVRDGLAELHAGVQAYRAHTLRALTRQARGESIGSEASMTKLLWSELEQRTYEFGRDVLGPYAEVLSSEAPGKSPQLWNTLYWFSRAATIYAGTSEIQRNIISERVLGLPKG